MQRMTAPLHDDMTRPRLSHQGQIPHEVEQFVPQRLPLPTHHARGCVVQKHRIGPSRTPSTSGSPQSRDVVSANKGPGPAHFTLKLGASIGRPELNTARPLAFSNLGDRTLRWSPVRNAIANMHTQRLGRRPQRNRGAMRETYTFKQGQPISC